MELEVSEWSQFEEFVRNLRADLEKHRSQLATWLARMSHVQIRKAKKLLAGFLDGQVIERLAMAGRGQIDMEQTTLNIHSSILKMLPESARKQLRPSVEVEVVGPRGVSMRRLGDLSGFELAHVIDGKTGLLPAEAQAKRITKMVEKAKAVTDDLPEGGQVELRDGWIVLKDSAGAPLCRVLPRTLRKFLR